MLYVVTATYIRHSISVTTYSVKQFDDSEVTGAMAVQDFRSSVRSEERTDLASKKR